MVRSKTKRIGVAVVVLLVFGTGTAVGVSLTSLNFNPLEPGQGNVPDSSLVIETESLSYTGLDATKADLTINNTDTVDHTGDIHLTLVDSSGNSVTSTSKTGVSFPGNNTETSVTLDFTDTNVTNFDSVEVRIEETG